VNFLDNIEFTIFHNKHESARFFRYMLTFVNNDLVFFEKPGLETFNKFEEVRTCPILKVWKITVEFQRLLFLSVIESLFQLLIFMFRNRNNMAFG
jgi:hypothetical protein